MPTQPHYLPFKEVLIELHIHDQVVIGSNSFRTLKEFADYLNDNPEVLKVLRTGNLDNGIVIDKKQDMDIENRI